jgi:hypothetical protein
MVTGNHLRAARVLAGIDQISLARLAGITQSTLSHLEGKPGSTGKLPIRGRAGTLLAVYGVLGQFGVSCSAEGVQLASARNDGHSG